MSTTTLQDVFGFMDSRVHCVISTVNAGSRPEAAYVAFTCSKPLEIIIGTSKNSRKYQNIAQNKSVAVVIADDTGEVQYEGRTEDISNDMYDTLIAEGRFKGLDGQEEYRNDPTQIYIKISPLWVRYVVHDGVGAQITEFTEFTS